MLYIIAFFVGGFVFIFAGWIWEMMTAQRYGPLIRALDEHRAGQENATLLDDLLAGQLNDLDRTEIWNRMSWLWKETRGWALSNGGPLALVCLGGFCLLYILVWLKTLLLPNGDDLRLLLGGRGLLLHVSQRKRENG